jgi:putative zinc finger/helix-turn-helix YgiT family protein
MKTTRPKRIGKWRVPSECIACGAEDSYVKGQTKTEKVCHGEAFRVAHAHWKCTQCGMGILGPKEAAEAVRAAVVAYQQAHGLLTAAELRKARTIMEWSQSELVERTSLGIATIKRLESGMTVQTDANDVLLRRVLGISTSADLRFVIRNKACVQSPTPESRVYPQPVFHLRTGRNPDRKNAEEEILAC